MQRPVISHRPLTRQPFTVPTPSRSARRLLEGISRLGLVFLLLQVVWVLPALAGIAFSDDMEKEAEQWIADAPWQRVETDAASPSYSWTDSPGGDYGANLDVSLTSVPFNLAGAVSATLTFSHQYNIDLFSDRAWVEVSTDGGAQWLPMTSFAGSRPYWQEATVDLTRFVGNPAVQIRFRLVTDEARSWDGWYIDDVVVETELPPGLQVAWTEVDDSDPLTGNGDGRLQPGEEAILRLLLSNGDPTPHRRVRVDLTTSELGVELARTTEMLWQIPADSLAPRLLEFPVTMDLAAECLPKLPFSLEAASNQGLTELPVLVDGPSLKLAGFAVVDPGFNRALLTVSADGQEVRVIHEGPPFVAPLGVAVDQNGDFLVIDGSINTLFRVTPTGTVSTVASGFPMSGARRVAVDPDGNYVVTSFNNNALVRVTPDGGQSILASGPPLSGPFGVDVDANGNYVVANLWNSSIVTVSPTGQTSVVTAGLPLLYPVGLTVHPSGNYVVTCPITSQVFEVTPAGETTLLNLQSGLLVNGDKLIRWPSDVAIDDNGDLVLADMLGVIPGLIHLTSVRKESILVSGWQFDKPFGISAIPSQDCDPFLAPSDKDVEAASPKLRREPVQRRDETSVARESLTLELQTPAVQSERHRPGLEILLYPGRIRRY